VCSAHVVVCRMRKNCLIGHVLHVDDLLLAHGLEESHHGIDIAIETSLQLLGNFRVIGQPDVIAHVTTGSHQGEEPVVSDVAKLEFGALNNGLRETSRRRADTLKLLASENVYTSERALGSSVLSYLGLGHVNDLAGASLDHNEAALTGRSGLDGGAIGRARIGRIIVVLSVRHLRTGRRAQRVNASATARKC